MEPDALWTGLCLPLLRLLLGLTAGLFIAALLESLRWTQTLARLASPLARLAHLREPAGAAFALSFVSSASANAFLARQIESGELSFREVLLTNLFSALPAYLLHTPTLFLLIWPVLGWPTLIYILLTLLAAIIRTLFTLLLSRSLLPPQAIPKHLLETPPPSHEPPSQTHWRNAPAKAWKRFLHRLPRVIGITVPIYTVMYVLHQYGFFALAERWMAAHANWLSFLRPETMGIIVLHLAAELGAALGAAGSVLHLGTVAPEEIVLALLVGNILSTPMRALRHQFPAYAAFFSPQRAFFLILANQGLRAASMILITLLYYLSIR